MNLKICTTEDLLLDKIYKESMEDLNKFYEIDWVHHTPIIIQVENRKTIEALKRQKTEAWSIGWNDHGNIFILDRNNLEKESSHKYTLELYSYHIKHELSHAFYEVVSDGEYHPIWLTEGVAIYTSGQNQFKKTPEKFSKFLEFYEKGGADVYSESGFVVKILVDKFGKHKLFELIKGTKNIDSRDDFGKLFKNVYGFDPTYEEFNKIYAHPKTNI